MNRQALIHQLPPHSLNGGNIEAASFATIDREIPDHLFSSEQWEIVRRMIHTTGDFSIRNSVRFSAEALPSGIEALQAGRPLVVDSRMIQSGLSLARLRSVRASYAASDIHCFVSDEDVMRQAADQDITRSVLAVRKAKRILDNGIVVFGNSPTGLLELNRLMIEEGITPALVVAVPVGFVHVQESKNELLQLEVPSIVLDGRRGGSPIAVSIIHALCSLAKAEKNRLASHGSPANGFDAIIILGHGSRVPGADRSMQKLAEALREKGKYRNVETCSMSRLGPHFEDVFERCVLNGARHILLLPYFLNDGLHILLDIPSRMQEAVRRYPEVRLVFGKNLGFNPLLVQLVEERIQESMLLGDVRDLPLPEENDYPIPHGQYEFVPMTPEEAARWRAARQSAIPS